MKLKLHLTSPHHQSERPVFLLAPGLRRRVSVGVRLKLFQVALSQKISHRPIASLNGVMATSAKNREKSKKAKHDKPQCHDDLHQRESAPHRLHPSVQTIFTPV